MLKTDEIDLRGLLDELDEPLLPVLEVAEADADDDFDGVCTQHDGCRTIS